MTTRKPITTTRKVADAPTARVPADTVFRLHATTALSRILHGKAEEVPDLLAALDPADRAVLAWAADLLSVLARDAAAEGAA